MRRKEIHRPSGDHALGVQTLDPPNIVIWRLFVPIRVNDEQFQRFSNRERINNFLRHHGLASKSSDTSLSVNARL